MSKIPMIRCDICKAEFRVGPGASKERGAWMEYHLDIRDTNDKKPPHPISGDACPTCTKAINNFMKGLR